MIRVMKRITVLLAEDFVLVREALRAVLADEDDLEVVGEAETGREALLLTKTLCPVVQKLDIHDTAGLTRYAIAVGIIEIHTLVSQTAGQTIKKEASRLCCN